MARLPKTAIGFSLLLTVQTCCTQRHQKDTLHGCFFDDVSTARTVSPQEMCAFILKPHWEAIRKLKGFAVISSSMCYINYRLFLVTVV